MKFLDLKTKLNGNWNEIEGLIKQEYVSIKTKNGIAQQSIAIDEETKKYINNLIDIKNGFATLNRIENEINLFYLLCELYTNIEFDSDFSDEDYDFLKSNGFEDWLRKITKNDCWEFSQLFKNVVLDEVRRLNSSTSLDIEGLKGAFEKLENLDPDVLEALKGLNPTNLKTMREMVDNERNSSN